MATEDRNGSWTPAAWLGPLLATMTLPLAAVLGLVGSVAFLDNSVRNNWQFAIVAVACVAAGAAFAVFRLWKRVIVVGGVSGWLTIAACFLTGVLSDPLVTARMESQSSPAWLTGLWIAIFFTCLTAFLDWRDSPVFSSGYWALLVENTTLSVKTAKLRREVVKLEAKHEDLEPKVRGLDADHKRLEPKVRELEARRDALEAGVKELEAERNSLVAELDKIKADRGSSGQG